MITAGAVVVALSYFHLPWLRWTGVVTFFSVSLMLLTVVIEVLTVRITGASTRIALYEQDKRAQNRTPRDKQQHPLS